MNKDALFATLIGLGIGLLLTGIILVGPILFKKIPNLPSIHIAQITLPRISFPKKASATPTPNQQQAAKVTIESPLSEAVETSDQLLVSGSTSADAKVVVQGVIDDSVIIANASGKYAGKITLSEGKNDVVVTSYSASGEQKTAQVTVYYTPEQW